MTRGHAALEARAAAADVLRAGLEGDEDVDKDASVWAGPAASEEMLSEAGGHVTALKGSAVAVHASDISQRCSIVPYLVVISA